MADGQSGAVSNGQAIYTQLMQHNQQSEYTFLGMMAYCCLPVTYDHVGNRDSMNTQQN